MLKACVLDFSRSWDEHLSLVEFAYNNSFQSSIGRAPFDALYGRKSRTPLCWEDVGDRKLLGLELVQMTTDKVYLAKDHLRTVQSRQKSYADHPR